MQEFLAFSEGPVSLEDVLRVQGQKVETSTQAFQLASSEKESAEEREKKRATFLMSWEPRRSAEGSVCSHPSIHHFCTDPMGPQLPHEMEVLSRSTHAKPGIVEPKSSSYHQIKVRINSSTIGLTTSKDFDSWTESKSQGSYPSLPSKKRKTGSSQQSLSRSIGTPLTSSCDDFKSDDIIGMAKARLKRELKDSNRSKSPQKKVKDDPSGPDIKRMVIESPPIRSSLKPSDERQSSRGSLSTSPTKSVRFSSVGDDVSRSNEMYLTGTRMEIVKDPSRYCLCTLYRH